MPERGCDLLVTGFGPYPRVRVNPTAQLAARVAQSPQFQRLGLRARAHVFETSYADVGSTLPDVLDRLKPAAVLHLGLAPRSAKIRVETTARGRASILHPDQRKVRPGASAAPSGPQYATVVPARLLAVLLRRGLPARLSNDAGRYLCDFTYHRSLCAADATRAVVFVHLPWIGPHRRPAGKHAPRLTMVAMVPALIEIALQLMATARLRVVSN